jgi:hypothetical protein
MQGHSKGKPWNFSSRKVASGEILYGSREKIIQEGLEL